MSQRLVVRLPVALEVANEVVRHRLAEARTAVEQRAPPRTVRGGVRQQVRVNASSMASPGVRGRARVVTYGVLFRPDQSLGSQRAGTGGPDMLWPLRLEMLKPIPHLRVEAIELRQEAALVSAAGPTASASNVRMAVSVRP